MLGENLKQMELLFQPTLRTKLQMVESSNFAHLLFSTANLQQLRFSFDLKAIPFHSQNSARYPEIYIFSTLTKGNTGKMRQYKRRFAWHENGTNTPADFRSAKINKVAKSNWIIVYIYRAIFFSNP